MDALIHGLNDRLLALHKSIEKALAGLPDEAMDWSPGPDMNSLGVLLAHTLGAERYWIGDVAGNEPSGRVREAEFMTTGRGVQLLIDQAGETLAHSQSVLGRMSLTGLGDYRTARNGEEVTVAWAILHALEHTAIHAGHIEMTRQLWDQQHSGPDKP